MKITFNEYNGIEGYIELMKHDVESLNDPECIRLDLCYNGKDIKAVLDYITNLQQRISKAIEYIEKNKQISMFADLRKEGTHQYTIECDVDDLLNILRGEENECKRNV